MILIINSFEKEFNVARVVKILKQKKVKFIEKKLSQIINSRNQIYISNNSFEANYELFDPKELKSIWFRRAYESSHDKDAIESYIYYEGVAFVQGFLHMYNDKIYYLNKPDSLPRSNNKIYQLFAASQFKMTIPDTTIGNNFLKFEDRFSDELINKSLHNSKLTDTDPEENNSADRLILNSISLLTRKTDKQSLIANTSFCPIIVQNNLKKEYELRVTYVKGKFFTAQILSQSIDDEDINTDWRNASHSPDIFKKIIKKIILPEDLEIKITKYMQFLGLDFGCLDFIVDTDGNYIFLEVNTAGNWLWIEDILGYDISDYIAEVLISPEKY